MARLSFRCSEELFVGVDRVRGRVPRERWLRDAVEAAVKGMDVDVWRALKGDPVEQALEDVQDPMKAESPEPGSLPPAPAEQRYRPQPGPNVENIRSSAQVKRDVRPIPKGGKS